VEQIISADGVERHPECHVTAVVRTIAYDLSNRPFVVSGFEEMRRSMEYRLTLPALQFSLDRLAVARSLSLTSKQIERLFGFNDGGISRLKHFAKGHNCVVAYADDTVVFHEVTGRKSGPSPS
jgi:hypothetical protein